MNTQTHVLLNLALLDRRERGGESRGREVAIGALIPDLPIFVFYGYQKLYLGRSEEAIWGEIYFEPFWQGFVDLFNSLPLVAVALAVAWAAGRRGIFFGSASAGLHLAADFPLHTSDAHAHFWPFVDWKFRSPVSYWDPAAHGDIFTLFETGMVVALGWVLLRRYESNWGRAGVGLLVSAHAVLWGFAYLFWM